MTAKAVLIGVLGLALAAGIAIGGWQLHWWMAQSAQGHINHIQRYSYGFQTAQLQDAETVYSQVATLDSEISAQPANALALSAQKKALEVQFCGDYQTLVTIQIPATIQQFAIGACSTQVQP